MWELIFASHFPTNIHIIKIPFLMNSTCISLNAISWVYTWENRNALLKVTFLKQSDNLTIATNAVFLPFFPKGLTHVFLHTMFQPLLFAFKKIKFSSSKRVWISSLRVLTINYQWEIRVLIAACVPLITYFWWRCMRNEWTQRLCSFLYPKQACSLYWSFSFLAHIYDSSRILLWCHLRML